MPILGNEEQTIPLLLVPNVRHMNLIVVVDIFSSNIVSNYAVTAIPLLVSGYVPFRGPFTVCESRKKLPPYDVNG